MRTIIWLITLTLLWLGITGSTSPSNIGVGLVVAIIAVWFIRAQVGIHAMARPWPAFLLTLTFVWELIKSATTVAAQVLQPNLRTLRPGIIAIPLSADQDIEIAVLANLITLTPGTLSVDVSADKSTLYVHALDVDDADAMRRDIKHTFERQVMRVFR